MPESTISLVAPAYLSPECLPYASDIFYHGRLLYFGPTGIHPMEWHAVAGFPEYCSAKGVAMPKILWEMVEEYFENSRLAVQAGEILRPLQPKHVLIALAIYNRDTVAIENARKRLREDGSLLELFKRTDFTLRFPAREVLSHLFCDLFMQHGYEGVLGYLRTETETVDKLIELIAAVMLNRFRLLVGRESSLLLYDHTWYPFLLRCVTQPPIETKEVQGTDSDDVEHLCYKLFETVLLPIFGRVDSTAKAELVARVAAERESEITEMKLQCRYVARELVTLRSRDVSLKNEVISDAIEQRILDPLVSLIQKPKKDVLGLLRDFSLDSTVLGGLLALMHGFDASVVWTAAAAGALSAGFRYLVAEHSQRRIQPSSLLVDGMRRTNMEIETLLTHLRSITSAQLEIPPEWRSVAQGHLSGNRSEEGREGET